MGKRRQVHCEHLLLNQWIIVCDGKVIHRDGREFDAHLDGSRLFVDWNGTGFTVTQEGDNVLVWSNGSRWQRDEVCITNCVSSGKPENKNAICQRRRRRVSHVGYKKCYKCYNVTVRGNNMTRDYRIQ